MRALRCLLRSHVLRRTVGCLYRAIISVWCATAARRLYEVIESSLSDVVASCYALLTALDLPGAGARLNASALFAYTDHIRHEQPVFAAGKHPAAALPLVPAVCATYLCDAQAWKIW